MIKTLGIAKNVLLYTAIAPWFYSSLVTAQENNVVTANVVAADVTATSTYLWRGIDLSADAALQGQLAFMDPTGIHAEFFGSNVFGGSELQIAAGYRGNVNLLQFDAGGRYYYLPQYDSSNFAELYAGIRQGNFAAKVSFSPDAGSYLEGSLSLPAFDQWYVDLHGGHFAVDKNNGGATIPLKAYSDFSIALRSQLDNTRFAFTLSGTTLDDGEAKMGRNTDNFRTVITLSRQIQP